MATPRKATSSKPTTKNSQGTNRNVKQQKQAYRAGKRASASGTVNERRYIADRTYRRGVKGKTTTWLKRVD